MIAEAAGAGRAVGGRAGSKVESEGRGLAGRGLAISATPSVHLSAVHRIALEAAGARAPFEAARKRLADAGARVAEQAAREIAAAPDAAGRLAVAARWAAAATHLDPRAAGLGVELAPAEVLADEVAAIARDPGAVDDTAIALELLKKARNVLFIHDGVGELAVDKLLQEALLEHCRRIYAAASGAPLAGRATLDDLHRAGIPDVVTEVFAMGRGEIGLVWDEAASDLKGKLEVVDLIVSKGQANVYALHDREKEILKPMFCLFRTMCDPAAELFGRKGRVTVLKVWK